MEFRFPESRDLILNLSHASTAVVALGLLDERGRGFERTGSPWGFCKDLTSSPCSREFVTCFCESNRVTSIPHSPLSLLARVRCCAGAYESWFCVPNYRLVLNKELR